MKIICSKNEFNSNLGLVSRIVPSRPTHPILANVLLIADEKKQQLTLTSFDLSMSISTHFPAEISHEGKITLPAKLLTDIVSRLPEGEIMMFYEPDDLEDNPLFTITSASGRFQIRSMGAEEYPELPVVEGENLNLPVSTLMQGFKSAAFAASPDETKQVLTGLHLQKTSTNLEFAATDGHRLAVGVQELDSFETEFSMTIPVRAFRELERLLNNAQPDENVELYLEETQVAFEFSSFRLTSRKLEGTYPAYHKLIPEKFSRQVTVDRKLLLRGLELMAVLADQRSNLVKFTIDTKEAKVILQVEAPDLGNAKESLPAEITGDHLDIGFNVKYLIDGLKAFNCTDIQIQLNEANQPVIFSPLGGNKITYLVMPVQLRD
ncbi:DNA polymerase III subunit beta [Gloeocapsa sp. PCC 73106]|uniref:DNA polymerase III subunit beta n=1 Tax=Gloeocapsa sp. PCC 73106 TaxID=102232 RepID=UPI0002ACBDB4|nr:DNA polymerase III subunit beta [Gloeocapsa sp. PCC 73106]ELR99660.1 DNA polymerase III, beta subunit [Gloeocapsa sp. PCC 73106]